MSNISDEKLIKLGQILKKAREDNNLTVRELAERSPYITTFEVSYLENAKRKRPDPIILKAFANALNLNYLELYALIGYVDDISSLNPISLDIVELTHGIPVYSKVFAGLHGYLEFGEIIEYISVPQIKNQKDVFGMKVEGTSMENTIPDKSTILVRKDLDIEDNEIGVFIYNNNPVVKRIKRENPIILLLSDNKDFNPIVVKEHDSFYIVGKVIQVTYTL